MNLTKGGLIITAMAWIESSASAQSAEAGICYTVPAMYCQRGEDVGSKSTEIGKGYFLVSD